MIKIEIEKPVITVLIRTEDKDGKTTEQDWKNLASALKKSLRRVDEQFSREMHFVEFLIKNRGYFDVEGSKEEVEAGIQAIKKVAQAQNIELEIMD